MIGDSNGIKQQLFNYAQQEKDKFLSVFDKNAEQETSSSSSTLNEILLQKEEGLLKNKRSFYEGVVELIRKTVENANRR